MRLPSHASNGRGVTPAVRYTAWLAWLALAAIALATRFPTAIDETRYLTVAWEMLSRGDWLVPHLNGAPYSHKPPLLFWLIAGGWTVFGVNDWWPRAVAMLAGAGSWWLTLRLARRLWPGLDGVGELAVLGLGATLAWVVYSTAIMFDILLTLTVLLGMLGLLQAGDGRRSGWVLFGAGLGLGILAKGPVALLHLLLPAVLAPWWSGVARIRPGAWFGGLVAGTLLGAGIALAWVVPAANSGGHEYASMIFWGQTAERVTQSFAHQRPLWWYLPVLPVMLLPWTLLPGAWRALRAGLAGRDRGARFCLAWAGPVFLAFCLVSGKQPHYLLPLLPALALVFGHGVTRKADSYGRLTRALALAPWAILSGALLVGALEDIEWYRDWLTGAHPAWALAILATLAWALLPDGLDAQSSIVRLHVVSVAAVALVLAALHGSPRGQAYGVTRAATEVAWLQARGATIGYLGSYHGQFGQAGRLRRPLVVVRDRAGIEDLAARDGSALVVVDSRLDPRSAHPALPDAVFPYRAGYWSVWPAAALLARPGLLRQIGARGTARVEDEE